MARHSSCSPATIGASVTSCPPMGSAFCFGLVVDQRTRPILRRPQHRLFRAIAKLLDIAGLNVLELAEELARLCPLAIGTECDVARDGREARRVNVFGDLIVIERLG